MLRLLMFYTFHEVFMFGFSMFPGLLTYPEMPHPISNGVVTPPFTPSSAAFTPSPSLPSTITIAPLTTDASVTPTAH